MFSLPHLIHLKLGEYGDPAATTSDGSPLGPQMAAFGTLILFGGFVAVIAGVVYWRRSRDLIRDFSDAEVITP